MNEELADRYWAVRFESRKRQFYYSGRMRFWAFLNAAAQIAGFIASIGAYIAIMQGHSTIAKWAALAVAAISAIALCLKAGDKARECQRFYMAYVHLEGTVPPPSSGKQTEDAATTAERELRELVGADAWQIPCLDKQCDNAACVAFGVPPRFRLGWIARTVGQILPIPFAG